MVIIRACRWSGVWHGKTIGAAGKECQALGKTYSEASPKTLFVMKAHRPFMIGALPFWFAPSLSEFELEGELHLPR